MCPPKFIKAFRLIGLAVAAALISISCGCAQMRAHQRDNLSQSIGQRVQAAVDQQTRTAVAEQAAGDAINAGMITGGGATGVLAVVFGIGQWLYNRRRQRKRNEIGNEIGNEIAAAA